VSRSFGKYRLLDRIASGGMAEVWRAEAPGAEGFVKEVALKLIRGDHDARGDFVQMFIQEARLASRLTHANIVHVFDFDQVDGRYYIAMELVRGRTLREVVDRCRSLGLRPGLARAVHIGAEVARALAYAHRLEENGRPAGLVHRDVSPHNVLISFEGEVKLADFGIARALGASEVTAPGTIKGKLAYMAPEQARGDGLDARADVFALGAVLWELCTGRRLFGRDSDVATLNALMAEPVSAPSAWNEAVPPDLDALILSALERDPAQRTASAEELASRLGSMRLRLASDHQDLDLRSLMGQLWPEGDAGRWDGGGTVVKGAPGATAVKPAEAGSEDSTRTVVRPRRGRAPARGGAPGRRLALVAGLALVLGAGLVAALAASGPALLGRWRGRGGDPARPPASASPEAAAVPAPTASPEGASGAARPDPAAPAGPAPEAPEAETGGAASQPGGGEASAEAIPASLAIRSSSWAQITIDGAAAGETPIEESVAPGVHRLRASHPRLGTDEIVVTLRPGQRYVWRPKLSR
jgi:serine/threonine-protein kinase